MWKNREQWGAPRSFPTSQWGGGRGLVESSLSLYMNGPMSCLYPEPGWLVPGAQEQGAHTTGKEREREVVRETREHHAVLTLRHGEGRCRRDSEACAFLTPLLLTLPVPACSWGILINGPREVERGQSLQLHSTGCAGFV